SFLGLLYHILQRNPADRSASILRFPIYSVFTFFTMDIPASFLTGPAAETATEAATTSTMIASSQTGSSQGSPHLSVTRRVKANRFRGIPTAQPVRIHHIP